MAEEECGSSTIPPTPAEQVKIDETALRGAGRTGGKLWIIPEPDK